IGCSPCALVVLLRRCSPGSGDQSVTGRTIARRQSLAVWGGLLPWIVSRKRNKTRRPGEYSGHFDGIGRSLTRIRKERTAVIQEAYIHGVFHGVSTPMACAKCSAWRSGPR